MKIEAPNFKAYLDSSIQYEMSAILKKLKKLKIKILDEIKKDFDKFEDLLLELPVEENKLSGDITYYLGVISFAYFRFYLNVKRLQFMNFINTIKI